MDLYELNEAFASVSVAANKELGVDASKVNVHGGAIALGHPIGASGTHLFNTMLNSFKLLTNSNQIAVLFQVLAS